MERTIEQKMEIMQYIKEASKIAPKKTFSTDTIFLEMGELAELIDDVEMRMFLDATTKTDKLFMQILFYSLKLY